MNGYNFTERVRKVLSLAREEATELHHEYVGTEHILLGLCREDGGVATAALRNLNVEPAKVRTSVLEHVVRGRPASGVVSPSPSGLLGTIAETFGVGRRDFDLPYTSRAKRALELSMSEARNLQHSYVGTEHILLGLLAEERGIAAQVLKATGVSLSTARDEVLRILGGERPEAGSVGEKSNAAELQAAITLIVEHPDGRIEAKKFRRTGDAVSFLNGLEY